MAFSDIEIREVNDRLDYCLPVRWFNEESWYEIKQRGINEENETVDLVVVQDVADPYAINLVKSDLIGETALSPTDMRQRVYLGGI